MSEQTALSKAHKYLLLAFAVSMGLLLLFYFETSSRPIGEKYKPIYELGGPFTIQGTEGPFSLSDIQGQVGVLYFGFLNCTEACPGSISVYQAARKQLSAEERQQVQFVFISVDPARDTPEELLAFEQYFNGTLTVASDTEENIRELTKQYGVYFDLIDLEGSELGYTVDHSSRFYMIDPQGNLITSMSHSTTPTELAAKIQQMLKPQEDAS